MEGITPTNDEPLTLLFDAHHSTHLFAVLLVLYVLLSPDTCTFLLYLIDRPLFFTLSTVHAGLYFCNNISFYNI